MTEYFDGFEAGALEEGGFEIELSPEDLERLERALRACLEILSAPGEANPESLVQAFETLEELHPYFSDARLSDQIGEVIELLHEISGEGVLDFHDAQEGKLTVEALAQALESSFTILKFDEAGEETFDDTD